MQNIIIIATVASSGSTRALGPEAPHYGECGASGGTLAPVGVRASVRVQRPQPPGVRRSGERLLRLTCTKLDIAQLRKRARSAPEATMRRVQEYQQNAQACRKMAAEADASQRLPIIQMAEMWDRLAADRRKLDMVRKQKTSGTPKRGFPA